MADTAHKDPSQVVEHFDSPEELDRKVKEIALLIRKARHCIFFTGAGISTSAGIPDFRGPDGIWTLKAQGKVPKSRNESIKAVPTPTHMAIVKLMQDGIVKYLISQNTDGLHRKSGVPLQKFSELHGNQTLEKCGGCGKEFIRDYRTRTASNVHDHKTGRKCNACSGDLHDSIINFGENLPQKELDNGFKESEKADLCIVLGSSLTVNPAAQMPQSVSSHGNLVICNLQNTPLDPRSSIRVYAKADHFMTLLMKQLNIEVPQWKLRRFVEVKCSLVKGIPKVIVAGVDADGLEASILKSVAIKLPFCSVYENPTPKLEHEPFVFDFAKKTDYAKKTEEDFSSWKAARLKKAALSLGNEAHLQPLEKSELIKQLLAAQDDPAAAARCTICLEFMGHYNEPILFLHPKLDEEIEVRYVLDYHPETGQWENTSISKKQ